MVSLIRKIFSKPKSLILALSLAVLFGLLLSFISQLSLIRGVYSLFGIEDRALYQSLMQIVIQGFSIMSAFEQVIFVLMSIVLGSNVVIFIEYLSVYRKAIKGSSASLSFFGLMVAVLGTGCLSCSVLFLGPLASVLGLSLVSYISRYGAIISVVGVVLVLVSSFILLKKIAKPNVCSIS